MGNEGLKPGVEIDSTKRVEQDIAVPEPQTEESETSTYQEIIEPKSEPEQAPETANIDPGEKKDVTAEVSDKLPSLEKVLRGYEKPTPDETQDIVKLIFEANSKKDAA